MHYMGVNEIREKFLSFFESKGCLRLDSFSLIPKNDASLLLINSGMAPMKKWFTGAEEPPRHRVTTCQKCIRTPDIERVGKTARHGTFFEMLGNFSFGDYFKREATAWAWEFFTKVMEIPEEKLWISVYENDDEAKDIWINEVGVDPSHIVKLGKEDNFWEHGTGPCGPCSEIYFDRGEEYGCGKPTCGVGCDCDRYMEVWNLVFTQFDKDENGNYNPLAKPNIDTGMGLERLAVVMQGVDNLFEVDTVQDVMKHISRIAGVEYKKDEKTDVSLRVITDHIRSTVMMVSDGVIPSNEGRGYVLRRLLRRAARHGKLLNIDREFLYEVAETVIDASKAAYPELDEKREYITKIIKKEEERFDATIDNGLTVLNKYIEDANAEGRKTLTGAEAFKLHDTYGFPLDLTIEMAAEKGLGVDIDGFNEAMEEQKQTAKNSRKDGSSWDDDTSFDFKGIAPTEFTGYTSLETEAEIKGIEANEGMAYIVTDKTPFYAEMGGQVGDIGTILQNGEVIGKVVNTTKTGYGLYVHHTELLGTPEPGTVVLKVDKTNRMAISRNHSATHLLHKALKEILGSHVAQAGSLVDSSHLRFDFSHFEAMTSEQLKEAEKRVNDAILECMPITVQELPIDEAKKLGAEAQFGEKYGDIVRVVSMGDYSIEFCGGTHLTNTAQCGLFKIVSEGGVAAGVRRIEAVTGQGVLDMISSYETVLSNAASALKTNRIMELDKKAESVMAENKAYEKKLDEFNERMAAMRTKNMMAGVKHLGNVNILTAQVDGVSVNELKALADKAKEQMTNGVVVLASNTDGKITFVAMAMKEAVAQGVHCGKIIKELTAVCGGKGGGKPDMAQGGGKDAMKIDDALAMTDEIVTAQIS
ncbi:MAG TPA: alanine--tRNA ligase [Candidatus Ornithomonoglobus merdipullorum]|uniref:Alanine--tRNA ligase n=1 Tax=Candidatus Ornithomonoglobus merdipullorum TaxID=2840895 RepID=A0A9D1MB88_9FIRM|nr:alanine--tRNA ligase [Candidatus Ornithomonoglobus merdipullorum]